MKKILVLDDDPQILKMITLMLEKRGFQVKTASNGSGIADKLSNAEFDLLITDILMPEVDGIEVINTCRKQGIKTAIIAMSGGRRKLSAEFNLKSATMLGADYVLEKPFSKQQLLSAVEAVLPQSISK